jgi:acyl-CoA thioester hydrolase
MKKQYFKSNPDDPAPLIATATRLVRFEEVDSLGIVWHGRYPSYFEDARVRLFENFDIAYLTLYHKGLVTPIKKMHVDYSLPLRFEDEVTIEAIMHFSEAARINIEYIIRNAAGAVATTGYTVQMMMDRDDNMLLVAPEFYQEFIEKWRNGELT